MTILSPRVIEMNDESAAIEIKNISKNFAGVRALSDLDLDVQYHQVFGLIGPDGAGKTTLMRILATVLKPNAGSARVFGYDLTSDSWSIKHRIGYMPQNFSLYRDLSVSENIAFYAGIYRVPKKKMAERLKWLLDFTGLGPFTGRTADALSGGMKQKLALACALIHEPDLLLLDEPTTGVDPVARREFWQNIEGLSTRGMTVFVSTPYMDEAERCHRIAFIDSGRIVREGSVDELKRNTPWKQFAVRGPELRALIRKIRAAPGVLGAQLVGAVIRIQGKLDLTAAEIRRALDDSEKYEIEEDRPGLEDIFAHLLDAAKKPEGRA